MGLVPSFLSRQHAHCLVKYPRQFLRRQCPRLWIERVLRVLRETRACPGCIPVRQHQLSFSRQGRRGTRLISRWLQTPCLERSGHLEERPQVRPPRRLSVQGLTLFRGELSVRLIQRLSRPP